MPYLTPLSKSCSIRKRKELLTNAYWLKPLLALTKNIKIQKFVSIVHNLTFATRFK